MSFASIQFLIFFAFVLGVLWLSRAPVLEKVAKGRMPQIRQFFLLVCSYIFYGWWDARFCLLMLALTVSAYLSAQKLEKGSGASRRLWLWLGVGGPLVVLAIFKYFNFFLESVERLLGMEDIRALAIILPVGISFYTFQSLSYVLDVYRQKYAAEKSFSKVALYIAFFPQLVAGPIVKAGDFLPQLYEDRKPTLRGLETGLQIFLFGMIKKVVLADHLSVFVDDVFSKPLAFSGPTVWWAVIAYSIQVYFDFSGYSDMAVGCAKCMGYDLCRNFNLPYLSKNVTEFWKRWHISLSSWLQEYLYFSLGGNRKGNRYVNLMITMLLGGLWHGANWTFVAWGGLHGLALCIHKGYRKVAGERSGNALTRGFSILGTYLFVCICLVFFRADDFTVAGQALGRMFWWESGIVQPYAWTFVAVIGLLIATIYAAVRSRGLGQIEGRYLCLDLTRFWGLVAFFTVVGLTIGLAYTGTSPFIYFQF